MKFLKKKINKTVLIFSALSALIIFLITVFSFSFYNKSVKLSQCPNIEDLISTEKYYEYNFKKKVYNFFGYQCDADELWKKIVTKVSKKNTDDLNQQVNNFINFIYLRVKNISIKKINTALDTDGIMITHPIKTLELRYAHCGQHARILVDGLKVLGVKSRVVQLNDHVVAEYYQDDNWIMIDLTNYPKNQNQFVNRKFKLDLIMNNSFFLNEYVDFVKDFRTRKVFTSRIYSQYEFPTPYVIKKIKDKNDVYYGWGFNNYEFCLRSEKYCLN